MDLSGSVTNGKGRVHGRVDGLQIKRGRHPHCEVKECPVYLIPISLSSLSLGKGCGDRSNRKGPI